MMERTAIEIRDDIKKGVIRAKDLLDEVYAKIEAEDKDINAFITLTKDYAYSKAKEIDEKVKDGKALGKLAGVPVAIKDNMNIDGIKTTCASKILENFVSPFDATVIEKINNEDAIIIGKTNLDEFAMGSSTETSYFGATKNPRDITRIPGGSSGGSAACVAAGFVPLALGSDTGGSIRQPASLCGVLGFKPTYGRVSRYGLVAFASSLDQIGPFARDAADLSLITEVISGYDKKDSTSSDLEVPRYLDELGKLNVKGLKIGIPKEYFGKGLDREIKERVLGKVKELESKGALVQDISMPNTEYAVATYYIIAPSEASSNLSRYDGIKYGFRTEDAKNLMEVYTKTRKQGFGDEVKRRIMLGTYALSSGYYDAYYLKAQKVRNLIAKDYENAFKEVDVIITPTTPEAAFKLGEKMNDPLAMYLSDVYTIAVNLAGVPGISVPCGKDSKNLPIGLQIIAPHFEETRLLQIAKILESDYEV